ncbi:MAG TPA: hypothetical protein VNQ97_14250 [Burkholderiaceae bacterium]|nr:hypothetical protein [Burkholderiaceae bacterium]
MKSLLAASLLALLAALFIARLYPPAPLEARLVHLQLAELAPDVADELVAETAELQALFLAYAHDPVLVAKARLALLRYPDKIRPIFLMLGETREFQDALRRYGEDITLPIHYFVTHEVATLELLHSLSESAQSALEAVRRMWDGSAPSKAEESGALSPEARGRYAVQFILAEGYDFLGQFVVSPAGDVGWVQTERILEGINSFFVGGIKGLEAKLRRDESIEAGDVAWAAVDVALGVTALKVLRLGKAGVAAGRPLTFSQRTAALGSGLWRGSVVGTRLVKYGAPAVLAYIAIRHPSVINSMLGSAAETLGLPVALVQVVGWTLVLLPVMLLLRFLLGPLAWAGAGMVALLKWLDRVLRRRTPVPRTVGRASV